MKNLIKIYNCLMLFYFNFSLLHAQGSAPYGEAGDQTAVYVNDTTLPWGYYEYLPLDFNSTSGQLYPVIIFFHGVGERSDNVPTNLTRVLNTGLPRNIENGLDLPAIVISPQAPWGWFEEQDFLTIYNYLKDSYPIDLNRVYVTGLSAGGAGTIRALRAHSDKIAAAVPICPADLISMSDPELRQTPIWFHHNFDDTVVYPANSIDSCNAIMDNGTSVMDIYPYGPNNSGANGDYTMNINDNGDWQLFSGASVPQNNLGFTLYRYGGHDAWTRTYNNQEVLDWMLSKTLDNTLVNQHPVANAGEDITTDQTTVTLVGSLSSDPDGNITSYAWSTTATATIVSPSSSVTEVTGLSEGEHTFVLTVTDDHGVTHSDSVLVTITFANTPPVANAGEDITTDQTTVTLVGSLSSDPDGNITSYAWNTTATATIVSPSSSVTEITGLSEGEHTFVLTVTDDDGATHSDSVLVTITFANTPPVANAGEDITTDQTTVTLVGSLSSDPDGNITSYAWSTTATTTIVSPSSEVTQVTGLSEGEHTFVLTVTDDDGATHSDSVLVTITFANTPPVANAGEDITTDQTTVTLVGSLSSDPDGNITSYAWSTTATATIVSPSSEVTQVTGLSEGEHTFVLTVTDDDGAIHSDSVLVTITFADTPPVANAGEDITTDIPMITLNAEGSFDPNGTITEYRWSTENANAEIVDTNSAVTEVRQLFAGVYEFTLTVTDNDNLTDSDTILVTVNAPNQPPVAMAGEDFVTKDRIILLDGSSSFDPDGTIVSYEWKSKEESDVIIKNPSNSITEISEVEAGTYIFELHVTDNDGAVHLDEITVTVEKDIFDIVGENEIRVYPNPVVSNFDVLSRLKILQITVINSVGVKVLEKNCRNETTLDISNLARGSYLLKICYQSNRKSVCEVKKIIKR